ncbi:CIC11C00000000408 [Sungouiella intermedia]|uniref:CIC11C00000000408 n=1 Tax=Sungouiella intermedia TaxID=45354 RepID=A0A1L0GQT0_9ASCO|nr:CIC11C00000000408 [[Candida] intermedia]
MFEELHRTHPVHLTNDKRNKFHFLISHNVNYRLIGEIEAQLGRKFSSGERNLLLRRLEEEYKKRPIQDESYEYWHVRQQKATVSEQRTEEDGRKRRKRQRTSERSQEDFDEEVKKTLIKELAEENLDSHFLDKARNLLSGQLADLIQNESESTSSLSSSSNSDHSDTSDSDLEDTETTSNNVISNKGDITPDLNWDDEAHPDSNYAIQKLKQWESGFDVLRTWARDQYQIKTWGLEYLQDSCEVVSSSLKKQHIKSLTTLLHINILRRKWNNAHKILCMIIRFDAADLRALWPLAVEILARQKEKMRLLGTVSKLELLKERQFLEWLSLSFPVSHNPVYSSYSFLGPVYRSANRRYAPIYVISLLWELLVEQNYAKLRDMTEDLLLQPPYSTDGVFHFLLALCNIAESIHLVSCYISFDDSSHSLAENEEIGDLAEDMMLMGSKETIKSRIVSNLSKSMKHLESCRNFHFEYPKELIESEINSLSLAIHENDFNFVENEISIIAAFHDKSGYILQNGKVHEGFGSSVLKGKYLKKLVAGTRNAKGTNRSWVWSWMRLGMEESNLCVCKICGEHVLKAKTSNKKLEDHLGQHNINRATIVPLSKSRTKRYRKLFRDMVSAQFDTRESGASKIDYRSGSSNLSNSRRANHNAEITNLSPTNRNDVWESLDLFQYSSLVQDTEDGDNGLQALLEGAVMKEEKCGSVRGVGPPVMKPSKEEYALSKVANSLSHDSSNDGSFTADGFNGLDEVTSQGPVGDIRRYQSFSPESTFEAPGDGDISRNFHQFASQTQEKYVDWIPQGTQSSMDELTSQAILNSFNDTGEIREGISVEVKDNSDTQVKEEELDN